MIRRSRLWCLAGALALSACATPPPSASKERTLPQTLPGIYDNYLQVWLAAQKEEAAAPLHLGLDVRRLDAATGERFLVTRRADGASVPVRRLLALTPAAGGAWRQRAYVIAADLETDGPWPATRLDALPRDPDCDAQWQRSGERWRAKVAEGRCRLKLGSDWSLDAQHWLVTGADGPALELRRARSFRGWMGVKRARIDPAADAQEWVFMPSFTLHSEGQTVRLSAKDGTPTGYAVQLETLVYQNTQTPVLKLGLIDEASEQTVTYIWANPDATRLGMNLRWFQVGLTALSEPPR